MTIDRHLCRLIAADLDGTLLDGQSRLTNRTIAAVRAAMNAGIRFVIASGRMPLALQAFFDALQTNAPVVAFNGALVIDMNSSEILDHRPLALDAARAICSAAEAEGLYVQAFYTPVYYYQKRTVFTDQYEKQAGVVGIETNQPLSTLLPVAPTKLLMMAEAEDTERWCARLAQQFSGCARIMRSTPCMIECVAPAVNKADALATVCARYGIAREEVLAFGDGENDIEMLKWAGYSFAMSNASDAVKAMATAVAPPHTEDGVAQILETYL